MPIRDVTSNGADLATEATLSSVDGKLPSAVASEATLSAVNGKLPTLSGGRLPVDGSGVTQPVSGPLTDTQLRATAVPVSAASLPLPSGAATSANQSTANSSLSSIDGKLPALSSSRVPVYATGGAASGASATGNPVMIAGVDGGGLVRVPLVDTSTRMWTMPSGFAAVGASTSTVNPVYVGGADGNGNARSLLTTTGGALQTYPVRTSLTASSPATASITTTSAAVIATNANRTGLVITNTHATSWLYLGIGATAVVGSGIALAPNGGCWTMDAHTFSTAAVNGIASAGTITVAVQEFA